MDYVVGDVQGCDDALGRLVEEIDFSPSRDRLFILGDLVNRGPSSLAVLQRLRGYGNAAVCLLGNHDLHLLAVAEGVQNVNRGDTFEEVLASPERDAHLDWLRRQPLALVHDGWLMVHAGVVPQWDTAQTLALAAEVQTLIAGPDLRELLLGMYGNEPRRWSDNLDGADRWRFIVNVLTRIRFCTVDGVIELKSKDGAALAPHGFRPWFDIPGRRTAGTPIACGHWSTLGLVNRADLLAIDTGCVWGGLLTVVRIDGGRRDIVQVRCVQAQRPVIDLAPLLPQ
jgi:bis(5'-nucleosyl)-tetraphosphatase (symmetrical)